METGELGAELLGHAMISHDLGHAVPIRSAMEHVEQKDRPKYIVRRRP